MREFFDSTFGCKGLGGGLGWQNLASDCWPGRSVRGVRIRLDDGVFRGGSCACGGVGWQDSAGCCRLGRSVRGVRISTDDGALRGGLASHFDCSRACGLAPSKKIDGVTLRIAASKEPQFWERKPMGFAAGGLGVSSRTPRGSIVPSSSRGP
jgi:hypothetical protein